MDFKNKKNLQLSIHFEQENPYSHIKHAVLARFPFYEFLL